MASVQGRRLKLTKIPEGAVFYGAAITLKKIARHDGVFPILQQHERVVYATGEHNGEVFEQATFVANSEEVAQRMDEAMNGAIALVTLWAADDENLKQIAQDVEVTRKGREVHSRYREKRRI